MVDYREFSRQIKEKYPDYKDVDDLKLANAMIEKYPEYKEQVTFEEEPTLPEIQLNEDGSLKQTLQGNVTKNVDLTPSGISKGIAENILAGVAAPFSAIKNKKSLPQAFSDFKANIRNKTRKYEELPSTKFLNNLENFAAYSALPVVKGGLGAQTLNAAAQGGLIAGLESTKNNGLNSQNLTDAGIGATIGAALPPVLRGSGIVAGKVVNSEPFKNATGRILEGLTSVPKTYIDLALTVTLAGKNFFEGKFNKDTAYIPVERKLRTALDKLPSKEDYAGMYSNLAKKAKAGIDKKLLEKNVELNNVIRNMPESASDISGLRANIDEGLNKFQFGDVNPALEEAGGVINNAKKNLGFQTQEEINQNLLNYANKYKNDIGLGTLDKEGEEIAFNILAQATGKNKNWLKSQLKAVAPKMPTEKRQEFIQELLEHTDDKIENFDPVWAERFPELNWQNLQETADGGETVARKMFDRIMGRNFSKTFANPTEQMFNEADVNYSNLLDNLVKNPNETGYINAVSELENIAQNMDDYSKNLYFERLIDDYNNIQNIVNPKIQPATLHGVKEMLYDRANFGADNFGNYGNSGIKSVASDINSYLRQQNPNYAGINDELKLLNSVKNDIGGPAGINPNTLSTKLKGIGSEANTLSNMDDKLKSLDTLIDNEYKFYNDAKTIAEEQAAQQEMLNLIGANQKLRNPRLLDNITDEGRLNALSRLQSKTGVNFMDELEAVRAREALENLLPGQGGGSGSAQGYGNLVRGAIAGGSTIGGAVAAHNPLALLGILAFSPKFMAKGAIKNMGLINNLSQREVNPGLYNLLIQGIGKTAGGEK
jgi:hypothetical protein